MAMPCGRAVDRMAHIDERAALRLRQAGDQAQKRRLARARTAEQSDDLAALQGQLDAVEHQQSRRRRAWERSGDTP